MKTILPLRLAPLCIVLALGTPAGVRADAPAVPAAAPVSAAVPTAAVPTTAAPVPVSDADKTGIGAAYDQINADFLRGDVDRFMSHFTTDYTARDERGRTTNRDQAQREYREQRAEIRSMSSHWTLQSLQPTTEGILVQMAMHSSGSGAKRVLFVTLRGTFTNDTQMRDLWVHTAQGWCIKRRQVLSDHTQSHPG